MKNPLRLHQIKSPLLRTLVKQISGIAVLEDFYDEWMNKDIHPQKRTASLFLDFTLDKLGVRYELNGKESLAHIPASGPVVIVSNHPLGGLEGVILSKILLTIRPADLKVLANRLLLQFPEFEGTFIGVDVLRSDRQRENSAGLRETARHLQNGGALLVFPAGTVSRIRLPSLKIKDAPWDNGIARLVRRYQATVLPIYIESKNSLPFYLSGLVHKRLRTLLLPRAMLSKKGTVIPVHIGKPIVARDLLAFHDDQSCIDYLRMSCKLAKQDIVLGQDVRKSLKQIRSDVDTDVLLNHIAKIERYMLIDNDDYAVYCAPYAKMGPIMEQLAIEREKTFRLADEGTGNDLDSDRFDPHYDHLFLWDRRINKIAGGYRLAKTDRIVETNGIEALYSRSLFRYGPSFLGKIGKSIEVGRSFIVIERQRDGRALDLLWRGIGHYVAENADYHTLFGCVSISKQYSKLVTAMLADSFLQHYGADDSIRSQVKPVSPFICKQKPWSADLISAFSSIAAINKLVGRIDVGKSIPVLIRHYLALNGRFISFSVNHGFGDALDGLIVVDLRNAPEKYLKRYMGQSGFETFHQKWKVINDAA